MGPPEPIERYASVAEWGRGLARQWGGEPLAEDPEKLRALASFCEFTGRDPDALLAFCFLRRKRTGERFTSARRREELTRQLAAFAAASGRRGVEARRLRSHVVSFLSHNGVLI